MMLCIKIKIKIQTFIGVRIVQFLHYSFYGGLYVLLRLFVQSQFVVEIHLCISPFRAHLYQILLARYMLGGNWKTVSTERLLTPTFYLTVVSHIQILEQQSWPFLNKNAVFFHFISLFTKISEFTYPNSIQISRYKSCLLKK